MDDWIYMKVSTMKGVIRFCKKRKLIPDILYLIESLRKWAMCLISWSYPSN